MGVDAGCHGAHHYRRKRHFASSCCRRIEGSDEAVVAEFEMRGIICGSQLKLVLGAGDEARIVDLKPAGRRSVTSMRVGQSFGFRTLMTATLRSAGLPSHSPPRRRAYNRCARSRSPSPAGSGWVRVLRPW